MKKVQGNALQVGQHLHPVLNTSLSDPDCIQGQNQSSSSELQPTGFKSELLPQEKFHLLYSIDPKLIRVPEHARRHHSEYVAEDYAELVQSILKSGGNVSPIMVIKTQVVAKKGKPSISDYMLVYGERRLQACIDAGVKVNAIFCDLDPVRAFLIGVHEGQLATKITPWAIGRKAKFGLEMGFFRSQRHAASELQRNVKDINCAISLASLPDEVIGAFGTADQLSFYYGPLLTSALKNDTTAVMHEANRVLKMTDKPTRKEILQLLCVAGGVVVGRSNTDKPKDEDSAGSQPVGSPNTGFTSVDIDCNGVSVGQMLFDHAGNTQLIFEPRLNDLTRAELIAQVSAVFASTFSGGSLCEKPEFGHAMFAGGHAQIAATPRPTSTALHAN